MAKRSAEQMFTTETGVHVFLSKYPHVNGQIRHDHRSNRPVHVSSFSLLNSYPAHRAYFQSLVKLNLSLNSVFGEYFSVTLQLPGRQQCQCRIHFGFYSDVGATATCL